MGLRLPHQNDLLVHLQWSDQFLSALRDGVPLPRWAHASVNGLGDPTFVYYQPLFYYLVVLRLSRRYPARADQPRWLDQRRELRLAPTN
jgi:hypothetical protein